MSDTAIHPDVKRVLDESDALTERLLTSIEKMRTLTAERVSKDEDIAVRVDMSGQLVDLWFKPGLLDRKDPRQIAKEVTQLATAAGEDAASRVDEIFQESRNAATRTADQP